jgi:hypothetical protein
MTNTSLTNSDTLSKYSGLSRNPNENAELESTKRQYYVERATPKLCAYLQYQDNCAVYQTRRSLKPLPREKVNIGKISEDVINVLQAQLDKTA